MRRLSSLVLAAAACLLAVPATAGVDARMLRFPDISDSTIAFVYAGDIWLVPRDGGTATRLSSPAGEEMFPRFSPDGTRLAFSGNYDGNLDIYVVPVTGGVPVRVTYHPAQDRLLDWTPDGTSLLFASDRQDPHLGRTRQLYTIPADGGMATRLPMPYGETGALSPDGRTLAYTPKSRDFRTWKRYRGGLAPDIWLFDLEKLSARNVTDTPANESFPMWHGGTLYFLSDRGPHMRSNIWAMDIGSGAARQVTRFDTEDVTFPAIGPRDIVFQAGGTLHRLDLADESTHAVPVEVVTDLATLKPQRENVSRLIAHAGISPSGKRAVFEARGEIFTVPREHGVVLQITHTSGAAERYPEWSPDGSKLAYWSDASGENELVIRPADGSGEERTVTALGPGFRYRPFWSPDSKRIAFVDSTRTIRILDVATGAVTEVDHEPWLLHPALDALTMSWSKDGRWLAYDRGLDTDNRAVFLYDTAAGSSHQVTAGYYSDTAPVFDPDGKYLYYLSNRDLAPVYSDLDATWVYPNTTRIVAVPLRADQASPLAPRNDVEEAEAPKGKDAAEKKPDAKKKERRRSPTRRTPVTAGPRRTTRSSSTSTASRPGGWCCRCRRATTAPCAPSPARSSCTACPAPAPPTRTVRWCTGTWASARRRPSSATPPATSSRPTARRSCSPTAVAGPSSRWHRGRSRTSRCPPATSPRSSTRGRSGASSSPTSGAPTATSSTTPTCTASTGTPCASSTVRSSTTPSRAGT